MTRERKHEHPLLNEHQHRALSTRLRILDQELHDAEKLAKGKLARGELFDTKSDLTVDETEELLGLIANAREHVRKLRNRFDLLVQSQDARRWLLGHFSALWAMMADSHAAGFKGFGDVSPELAPALDPEVDELIDILNKVKTLASRRK
jgi:hypothetical protein